MSRLAVTLVICLFFISLIQIFQDLSGDWKANEQEELEAIVKTYPDFKYEERFACEELQLSSDDPMQRFVLEMISIPLDTGKDYTDLGRRMRLLQGFFRDQQKLHETLFKQMFPWIKPDKISSDFTGIPGSKGIVISVGNELATCAVHTITALRLLNCTLPIAVAYSGVFDLSSENRSRLSSLNVNLIDICTFFDCPVLDLQKWDGKPFGMLVSPFEETLLMDADSIFLQDPSLLFEDEGYLRAGALFFHDRTMFPGNYDLAAWLAEILPKPISPSVRQSRIFRAQSYYEQESGVVLINKKRQLHALLTVCQLNLPEMREPIRRNTHGEKESFWMGFEVIGATYEFMPGMPGSIGRIESKDRRPRSRAPKRQQICGHLAHFDRKGRLLWFNDGLASGKKERDEYSLKQAALLTHYGQEGRWTDDLCLIGDSLQPLPSPTLELIAQMQYENDLRVQLQSISEE